MQKTGLSRAGSGRSQRTFGFFSNLNYDGKIAGLYDLEKTLGNITQLPITIRRTFCEFFARAAELLNTVLIFLKNCQLESLEDISKFFASGCHQDF